jgi:hypothetical protein
LGQGVRCGGEITQCCAVSAEREMEVRVKENI